MPQIRTCEAIILLGVCMGVKSCLLLFFENKVPRKIFGHEKDEVSKQIRII
jgi:hypothetical protein